MRSELFALVLVLACGRSGFDQHRLLDASDDAAEDSADPGADAEVDAAFDAPLQLPCGTTILDDDPFEDSVAGPVFFATPDTGLTLVEAAGHLDVQFAASVASGKYALYRSGTAYPVEGLCAAVEVSQVPSGGAAAFFKLRTAQLEVEFFAYNGLLDLRTRQSGSLTVRTRIPFDLLTDRFWRLLNQAGTTSWQTSADGISYTTRMSLAGFFTPLTAQVELGAGAPTAAANAGIARYERALIIGP